MEKKDCKKMLYKIQSLVTAEAVVSMVQNNESVRNKIDGRIESYQNGREQGLIIKPFNSKNAYYICEGRRSDSIYIYKGEYTLQSISEDAYRHCNTFGRNFDEAAEWLINELLVNAPLTA